MNRCILSLDYNHDKAALAPVSGHIAHLSLVLVCDTLATCIHGYEV